MQTPAAAEPGAKPDVGRVAAAAPDSARAPSSGERCANCGASITSNYCAQCGQRREHAVHSVSHFLREATEDLTHADSRLWRTIVPLLIRPGFLTREFLDGRRVTYLPPVRLYLVLSVLFFIIVAVVPQAQDTRFELVKPQDIPAAVASGDQPARTKIPSVVLTPFGPRGMTGGPVSAQRAQQICASFPYDGPWADRLAPDIQAHCVASVMDNSRHLKEKFLENVGRAVFLLLPLLALVMKALYRKPPRHYVEHLLFFVHNQAFLYLTMGVYALLTAYAPEPVHQTLWGALCLYVLVYFYLSMRRVYGQGPVLTGAKLGALSFVSMMLGALMLAATAVYAFLTS